MSVIIHQNLNDWIANGRLGNQMFKVASLTGIGLKNSAPYYLDAPWNYQKYFKIPLHVTNQKIKENLHDKVPYYHYEEVILDQNKVYGIEAYFQSEKYFLNCKEYIKEFFTLKPEYSDPLKEKFKHHLNKIAVHIRRTDYVNNGPIPALPIFYYTEAFTHFPNEEFLICSDDIEWCKQNFIGEQFYFQDEKHEDIFDLYLMSYLKGIIIANSSFSWWSAWLGERDGYKIIAPKAWMGGWISKDIVPERWPRIGGKFWLEPGV